MVDTFNKKLAVAPDQKELEEWLASHLPGTVFGAPPEITVDDDEILVVLRLDTGSLPSGEGEEAAERALIEKRRNETKGLRIQAGRRIARAFRRAVSWGMRAGATVELFTDNTAPVMTRLDRDQRRVLDTLITAGIANTRSSALGYVVRTFGIEHEAWLKEVDEAMTRVAGLRDKLQPEHREGPPPPDAKSSES